MSRRKKEKYLKTIIPLGIGLIFLLFLWLGYRLIFTKKPTFLESIDTSAYASITDEAIYGIHLNFKGNFTAPENVSDLQLMLANENEEINLPFNITNDNFTTSNFINKGINLEFLKEGTYYLVIKGTEKVNNKETTKYYSVENKSDYNDMEYYTLTKNGQNNKITLAWNTYEGCPTLRVNVEETTLPNDVYDITIDPGHGGSDPGTSATYNGQEYTEADLNLAVSLKLKEKLEQLGYKVAMTRTDDSDVNIYDKNGSAVLGNETKSKFNFAIHHNSFDYEAEELKGIEIYVASNIEFDFANMLVNNIIKEANTQISPKEVYQTAPGIYQRYFTDQDILDDEVQPSNKTTSMIYYYNIRELGGINTQATNDGRYENIGPYYYPKNPFYNSNNTTEPYLIELGYMNNQDDMSKIIGNEDKYAEGIIKALQEYLSDAQN